MVLANPYVFGGEPTETEEERRLRKARERAAFTGGYAGPVSSFYKGPELGTGTTTDQYPPDQPYVRPTQQVAPSAGESKGFLQQAGESLLDAAVRNIPVVGGMFVGGPAGAAVGKVAGEVAADAIQGKKPTGESVGKAAMKAGKSAVMGGTDASKAVEKGVEAAKQVVPEAAEKAVDLSMVDDGPQLSPQIQSILKGEYGKANKDILDARRILIEQPDSLNDMQIEQMQALLPGGQQKQLQAFNRAKALAQSPGMTRRLLERGGIDADTRKNLAAIGRAAVSEYDLFEKGGALDPKQLSGASNLDAGYGQGLVSPFAGQLDYQDKEMREFYEELAQMDRQPSREASTTASLQEAVTKAISPGRIPQSVALIPDVSPETLTTQSQLAADNLTQESVQRPSTRRGERAAERTLGMADDFLAGDGGMAEALASLNLDQIAQTPQRQDPLSNVAVADVTPSSLRAPRPSVPDAVLADRGASPAMVSIPNIPLGVVETGMNVPDPQARMLEQAAMPGVGSVVPGNVSSAAPAPMVSAGPPPMSPLEMARMQNTTPVPAALPPSQQPSSPFAAFPSAPPEPAPSAGFSPFGAPDDSYAPLESVGAGRPMGPMGGMADRGASPAFVSQPPVNVAIPTGMNVPQSMPLGRRGAETMLDVAARNTIAMNPQMQAQVQQAGPGYGGMYGQMQQSSNQGGGFSAFNQPVGNVAPPQSVLPPGLGRIDAPMGGMAPYSGAATQPSPELLYTDQNGNVRDRRTGQIVRAF